MVVVTGLSGSGRSTALRALEDIGYYCVDNLPASLLERLCDTLLPTGIFEVAVGMDLREGNFLQGLEPALTALAARGVSSDLLFLDCADEVLLRRFSETRRRHPIPGEPTVGAAIVRERTDLEALRTLATLAIDTTTLNVHQLKRRVQDFFDPSDASDRGLAVSVISFGFKHGVPFEADYVFDVRFLPNPHFVQDLRPLTGLDAGVRDYVLSSPEAATWFDRVRALLDFVLPQHDAEGRPVITVGVGCTGGQHRSVALAVRLAEHVRSTGYAVSLMHRDARGLEHPPRRADGGGLGKDWDDTR